MIGLDPHEVWPRRRDPEEWPAHSFVGPDLGCRTERPLWPGRRSLALGTRWPRSALLRNGSDEILGGSGADHLSGGAGNDQFWFLTADFQPTQSTRRHQRFRRDEREVRLSALFEGITSDQLPFSDVGSSLVISTAALGGSGGITLTNFIVAQLADQLILA